MRGSEKVRIPVGSSAFALLAVAVVVVGAILYAGPLSWRSDDGTVGGTSLSSDALFTYEVTRYDAHAIVTEPVEVERTISIGVATDRDSLKFGEIPAGSNYAMRELGLANLEHTPAKISVSAEGSIAPRLQFKENGFVLPGNSNTTVRVFFLAEGADIGEYEGEVLIQIKRPRFPALGMLE